MGDDKLEDLVSKTTEPKDKKKIYTAISNSDHQWLEEVGERIGANSDAETLRRVIIMARLYESEIDRVHFD